MPTEFGLSIAVLGVVGLVCVLGALVLRLSWWFLTGEW